LIKNIVIFLDLEIEVIVELLYTYEDACSRHEKDIQKFNNINENKDIEKVIDDLNIKNNN
jgi:hypothetical protein